MAWETPRTTWTTADVVTASDLNRIEGNTAALYDKFHQTNGHKHTGAAGDGPKLDPTQALTYTPVNRAGDTMTGPLEINTGSAALRLKPGSGDCVFIEFYADSQSPNTRSGYFGFPNAGSNNINLQNEMGGVINLIASDVLVNGRSAVTGRTTTPLKILYKTGLSFTTPGSTGWQKLATVTFDEAFAGTPFVVPAVNGAPNVAHGLMIGDLTSTGFSLWGYVDITNSTLWWSYLAIGPR